MNTDFTGDVLKAGVLGWPIGHSKSPRMHNHWLRKHNVNGVYLPYAISPEQFNVAVRGLQAAGLKGCNVTIPHKQAAFEISDRLSPAAKAIGAVNTFVFEQDGKILGHNTDAEGFMANLIQGAPKFDFVGKTALVLGAGGAAQAIVFALLDAGVKSVEISNRTVSRAEDLASRFEEASAVPGDQLQTALSHADILVNTTALGMSGQNKLALDLTRLPRHALVSDIVYTPLETELLIEAKAQGNPTVDGLGMLLHQAVSGFEAWFGVRPEVDEELRQLMLKT